MGNRTPRNARTPNTIINNPIIPIPIPIPIPNPPTQDPYLAAVQASIAEAPLPLGWEEALTSKGVTYYIDHVNGITTYQDPRLNAIVLNANLNNTNKKKKRRRKKNYPGLNVICTRNCNAYWLKFIRNKMMRVLCKFLYLERISFKIHLDLFLHWIL